jgi:hypothetical protein
MEDLSPWQWAAGGRNHSCEMQPNNVVDLSSELCTSQGIARTQTPTNKNYALELFTFGIIIGVSPTAVQWTSLTLGEPPS